MLSAIVLYKLEIYEIYVRFTELQFQVDFFALSVSLTDTMMHGYMQNMNFFYQMK